ncbi:MAG: phosphoglucosamine mutase [Pseudomonadota bacterium]|nr:phosphoglucosamine mutase [Pseudomonadota bacterium]
MTKKQTEKQQLFGTDGIRGRLGQGLITPEAFLRLGFALGQLFTGRVCLGYDGRASGEVLQHALISGLTASGVMVEILGVVPTPLVANWVKKNRLQAGIMITASHNDARDNGVKIFNSRGEKITQEQKLQLEEHLINNKQMISKRMGSSKDCANEGKQAYIEHIGKALRSNHLGGLKVVIDPAYGACSQIAKPLFESFGIEVKMIHDQADGYNINQNSGSTNPQRLQAAVLENGADMGVAFDGDGDRCVLVDNQGRILDGDNMLCIIANSALSSDRVVTTKMANPGLLSYFQQKRVGVVVTEVGDQHVYQAMQKHKINIGAEPNGHMIITPWCQGGDGPLSALMCMNESVMSARSLAEWHDSLVKFPQKLLALSYDCTEECQQLQDKVQTILSQAVGVKSNIRKSGTEPVLRVLLQAEPGEELLLDKLERQLIA